MWTSEPNLTEEERLALKMRDRLAGEPAGPHPYRVLHVDHFNVKFEASCPRCGYLFGGYVGPGHRSFTCDCRREFFIIIQHPDKEIYK